MWSVALATFSLVSPVTTTLIHHPSICVKIAPHGPDEDHSGGGAGGDPSSQEYPLDRSQDLFLCAKIEN